MPYLQTTEEFWKEIAEGTFAKVLHIKICEQKAQPEDIEERLKICLCRERFREALPGRYAKAVANDILFTDVPDETLNSLTVDEGVQEDAPQEETVAQRKRREKAEAEAAS